MNDGREKVIARPARPELRSVFRHRAYRLFFTGQLISLLGFWIQAIAQAWLVYRLSDSPLLLGLVGFANQVPVLLLSPFAGVVADRLERRRVLFVTQGVMMTSAFVLAALTLSHTVEVWHIVALAFVSGTANAFDVPTRQSFTIEMVGRQDLPLAIAANSIMFNAARLVGPAIAGVLVAAVGEGWCMALNGVSYLAVLTSLALLRVERQPPRPPSHPLADLREGFIYVSTHRETRTLLLLLAGSSLFGTAYLTLMPVFARDVLHGGSDALGFLMASVGAGALLGAIGISRVPAKLMPAMPFVSAVGFGLALVAFSQSTNFLLSMALLVPAGLGMMGQGVSTNTLLQSSTTDALRGRVMAYYVMAFIGMVPISSLVSGWASHYVGAPLTLAIGGTVVAALAVASYLRR
ncbi:MAG: MFS transporter [Alphaproteobacteria bacterium]|nr:MFS transporter [Alphaproteobacteria bacterium]